MELSNLQILLLALTALLLGGGVFTLLLASVFRRVVPTNEVHIVQSAKTTKSYGKDTGNGNSYYELPSWIPVFGITKVRLPMSVFDLDLESYEAYDKGRLPFNVDVKAFFRISDSNVAAQRVADFKELHNQLRAIVQGAVRVILASNNIEEILQGRSTFGEQFTREVAEQLTNWGVSTVKNIELMDIRDSKDSSVIRNIMEKKKSYIEMESRTEVAKNKQTAQVAEINAQREVDLQKQEASQLVGLRTVETQRNVELANQSKSQAVKEQERLTKDKEMSVLQVQSVRTAEIERDVKVVQSQQYKLSTIIQAEAQKELAVLTAEGTLEAKRKEAEAITLEGTARAAAETAIQLAPVQAQITLAKEIGSNQEYQKYLLTIRRIEADQAVGMQQAGALQAADIKIITNTGSPTTGLNTVMDLFTSKGGTELGGMLEALNQTEQGEKVVNAVFGENSALSKRNKATTGK